MAGKSIADLFINIGAKIDDFINGTNKVKKEATQLEQAMSKVGGAIVAAFAADKIIAFATEASKLAQISEGVEAAFKRIGGDQIMGQLQKATKGTVSDLELMKAAVQANNFKIPLDQLGSLLSFAHQRAKDTGQSVDYLVQSIVMGIGRKCLIGSTLVKTKNGLKRLDILKPNEIVFTLSLTGEVVEGVINSVHNNGLRDVYKVTLVNGYEITGTENHRLYTDKGYKMIMELTPKSLLLTDSGLIQINSIDYVGISEVYDITLPETENFFANGIVSHNSPLILDNLGISAVALKEKMGGVASEMATVGDVAKAVGAIASEEMAKIGESVETTSERFARQQAIIQNWKVDIGKAVNAVVGVFTSLIAVLDDTINRMATIISSKNLSGWEKFIAMLDSRKFEKVSDELDALQRSATINADAWLSKVTNHLKTFEGDAAKAMQFLKDKRLELVSQMGEFESLPLDRKSWPDAYKVAFSEIQIEYNKLNEMINNPKGIDDMLFPEGVDKVVSDIEKVEDKLAWLSEWGKGGQTGSKPVYGTDEDRMMSGLFGDQMGTVGGLGLTGDTQTGLDAIDAYQNKLNSLRETVSEVSIDVGGMMSDMVIGFAESIGEMIAGTGDMDDFGKSILIAIGGFMKQLGAQMITMAFAGYALQIGIENPAILLAAGIALVAAGAAVSTLASSNPAGGSRSVSSGSYSGMSSNKDMKLEIVGMVKGTDIYWSQKRLDKQLNNTTVRSGR